MTPGSSENASTPGQSSKAGQAARGSPAEAGDSRSRAGFAICLLPVAPDCKCILKCRRPVPIDGGSLHVGEAAHEHGACGCKLVRLACHHSSTLPVNPSNPSSTSQLSTQSGAHVRLCMPAGCQWLA